MSTTDRLNEIYEAHKDQLGHGFHNCLWQIMVEGCLSSSPYEYAFTTLHSGMMVISASDGGYLQGCQVRVIDGAIHEGGHEAARSLAATLNEKVFGLTPDGAMRVLCKSMSQQRWPHSGRERDDG